MAGAAKRLDVDEPLVGEQGLENGVGAVAARHRELVRFDALDQTQRLEVGDDALARDGAIQAAIGDGARCR